MNNLQKIKYIAQKTYRNFYIYLEPASYFNAHLLQTNYPELKIPNQSATYEVGYAKFKMTVFMSENKLKDLNEYLTSLKDKHIVPTVSMEIFFPLFNKKMACDEKNFNRLGFVFLEGMSIYFQEFDKKNFRFNTPEISQSDYQELIRYTEKISQTLLDKVKFLNVVEEQIKLVLKNKVLDSFDMNMLPSAYSLDDFISLPEISKEKSDTRQKRYLGNKKNETKYKHRFIQTLAKMFVL